MKDLILQVAGWYAEEPVRTESRRRCELKVGDSAMVRCDSATGALDVVPTAGQPHAAAVVITAHSGHWCLTNLHVEDTYVVESMERGGEFVKVAPRRRDIPIPFELARLVLPAAYGVDLVKVFGPEPSYLTADAASGAVINRPHLDERSVYFRVLVALCEPQLRGYPPGAVPTTTEVIARLRDGPNPRELTRAAVNHHISYLATEKLRIGEWAGSTTGRRSYWKRQAIVSIALRHDLVREWHLGLLPSRCVTGRQEPGPPIAPGHRRRPRQ